MLVRKICHPLTMRIYLIGPITGHNNAEIESWRSVATRRLKHFAEIVDPASYSYDNTTAFRSREEPASALTRLRHGQFVVERNKKLIRDSDVVFANFLGSTNHPSIGSIGELFWANAFDKPIVIAREKYGNIHDHAMINAIAGIVCFSLDEAVAAVSEFGGRKHSRKQIALP